MASDWKVGPTVLRIALGLLFIVFLGCLVLAYIGSNVLRKHGLLEWMGISGPKR